MDWIVFSRCGQRRRKRQSKIERMDKLDEDLAEADVEIGDATPTRKDAGRPVTSTPSPPGSTVEEQPIGLDDVKEHTEMFAVKYTEDTALGNVEQTSSHADSPIMLEATKVSCGCETSSRPSNKQLAFAKL